MAALASARGAPIALGQPESRSPWDFLFRNYRTDTSISFRGDFDRTSAEVELSAIDQEVISPAVLSSGGGTDSAQNLSQALKVTVSTGGDVREYIQTIAQQTVAQPSIAAFNLQIGSFALKLEPNAKPLLNANIMMGRIKSSQPDIAQRYSDVRLLNRQGAFLKALQAVDPAIKSAEVLVAGGQSQLHLGVDDLLMPLSSFGEGMATVGDIISLIYSKNAEVVLIDEIENGIHYSVLQDVWWHIKRAVRASGTQVIVTTHSRECLEAAQRAFAKDAANMLGLLRLARKPDGSGDVTATSYSSREIETGLELNLDMR